MKKEINKKEIVKFAASGLLTIVFGLHIYDSNIDHTNEYCPLNNIFGAQHQIHEINNRYAAYGINAFYAENGEVQFVSSPIKTEYDGKTIYTVPSGYILYNGKVVKTVKYTDGEEAIVLTDGIPVYPEGAQPGDIIRKSDIQVYDPQVVKIIKNNNKEIIDEEIDRMELSISKNLSR